MKKIFLMLIAVTLLLTGCGKVNEKTIKEKFIKDSTSLKSYHLEGELVLTNNDDVYKYNTKVSYKTPDNYKVELINQSNSYQQILLRNSDGIYVYTPSLNKSFKFQSEWPYNNSQVYILKSLAEDLNNDQNYTFKQDKDNYIFTTKVDYPNNPDLVKQNIYLDKNQNLVKVEVLNKNDIPLITFTVNSIDKKPTFNDDYFILKEEKVTEDQTKNNNKKEEDKKENTTETTSTTLNNSLFPMYLPENTKLANKETIDTDQGQRIIMTFSGDKPFILVQETASKEKELTIVPTYGQPFLLIDTVGSLTDISYTWTSNNVEYYIVSDVLEQNELLEVAKSIGVVATINEK